VPFPKFSAVVLSSIPKPPAEWALKLDILITHISQFTETKIELAKGRIKQTKHVLMKKLQP
jgi:predicted GTPase